MIYDDDGCQLIRSWIRVYCSLICLIGKKSIFMEKTTNGVLKALRVCFFLNIEYFIQEIKDICQDWFLGQANFSKMCLKYFENSI